MEEEKNESIKPIEIYVSLFSQKDEGKEAGTNEVRKN
jgi:hypothetical protein